MHIFQISENAEYWYLFAKIGVKYWYLQDWIAKYWYLGNAEYWYLFAKIGVDTAENEPEVPI